MKKILCFGDSNTWGHDPKDGSRLEKTWPEILGELLENCNVIADGVCGRTTAYDLPDDYGKNGFEYFKKYIDDENGADILVIMLGTNDTLNLFNKTAKESAENIRGYIKLWKNAFPKSEVIIVSPIHITGDAMKHEVFSQVYSHNSILESHNFAAEFVKIAKEEEVYFRDASLYAQPSALDGIHLDIEGHEKLAKAIAECIMNIIRRDTK